MVNFYEASFNYDYSFPAVALAYFLRYPNPYSTHVLSSDVIERHYDPVTQKLHTTRLHAKKTKLPSAILRLIPKSILGTAASGESQSYILETSVVDVKDGWMDTESRNLEWTGILSVIERQMFRRPLDLQAAETTTDVKTSVTLLSRFGQNIFKRKAKADGSEPEEKVGFFKSWSTASVQRSIELIGLKRLRQSQPNTREGMRIVLERLRQGGLVAVLDGMRKDREMALKHGGPLKQIQAKQSE